MAENHKVTVAVVFHNEGKGINDLLNSIDQFIGDHAEDFPFLFIDNASSDNTGKIVQTWGKKNSSIEFELHTRRSNHMAYARQDALELTKTPWVVFVDADAVINPGWFENIQLVLEDLDQDVAGVGGHSDFFGDQYWHAYARSLGQLFPIGKLPSKRVEVNHVPTNNYLVNRKMAVEAGGFNPFFQRVGEDLEFNVRLRKVGKIVYDSSFSVAHKLPDTVLQWYGKMALYGRAQTYVVLERRHGIPVEKFIPLLLCFLMVGLMQSFPLITGSLFFFSQLIPRVRFFTLTFLFYGLGEFVGLFRYFFLKATQSSRALATRTAE